MVEKKEEMTKEGKLKEEVVQEEELEEEEEVEKEDQKRLELQATNPSEAAWAGPAPADRLVPAQSPHPPPLSTTPSPPRPPLPLACLGPGTDGERRAGGREEERVGEIAPLFGALAPGALLWVFTVGLL